MKQAIVELESTAPYSQSRLHNTPKLDRETADAYEQRTWIEKGHYDENGEMFLPPMCLKFALISAAKSLGLQIKGKGKKTYKGAFTNGIVVLDPVKLGIKKSDVKPNWILANADGIRGGGKRVTRAFPTVPKWKGTAVFTIVNEDITESVFKQHLEEAGKLIGIGQFRPEVGGYFGRFKINSLKWADA